MEIRDISYNVASDGPTTLEQAIQIDALKKQKYAFLESLGFWEVEIQEILKYDRHPFDDAWRNEMLKKLFAGNADKIAAATKPKQKKKPAVLPWAAIACSGIVGIAKTYPEAPGSYWPAVGSVAGFLGLVLFVKWLVSLWRQESKNADQ